MPATGPLGAASLSSQCCGRLTKGRAGMYGPQECQLAHLHAGCNHCQSGVHHVPKHRRQRLPVWPGQVRTGDPAQTRDASVGSCHADPPLHVRAYSRARSCSHARSLRYFDIVADADLNVLNANIQLNAGKVIAAGDSNYFDPAWLRTAPCSHSAACVPARAGSRRAALPLSHLQFSFRLKRFCSNGTVPYTSAFNGISFPGSTVGNVTYFSLSPSYVARPGRPFG